MPSSYSGKGRGPGSVADSSLLYPDTRSALSVFVSRHVCEMCGKPPVEAEHLPDSDTGRQPHMFACCGKRACGKCVGKKDLKEMGSHCPMCKGPLLNVDVDHALLFHMETVRRIKKALWDEGPGKGHDGGDKAHLAISLSPTYESQKEDEGRGSSAAKRKSDAPSRRKSDASGTTPGTKKGSKGKKTPLAAAKKPKKEAIVSSPETSEDEKMDTDVKSEDSDDERLPPPPPSKVLPKTASAKKTPKTKAEKKPKVEKMTIKTPKMEKTTPKAEKAFEKVAIDSGAAFLAKTNNKGETKLHQACIKGNYNQVVEFLQDGADPNTKCNNGWTPLHESAQKGTTEIARVLLQAGAVPNICSFEYTTPLHEAVVSNQSAIVSLLLNHGADPDFRDHEGTTPKDLANGSGYHPITRLLADPDSQFSSLAERDESHMISFKSAREFLKKAGKMKLVIYFSGASQNEIKWARSVLTSLDGRLEQKELTNDVSHVMVTPSKSRKGDEGGSSAEARMARDGDVGYLRALAKGVPVVTVNWLKSCEEEGGLCRDEDFFVTGTPQMPDCDGPERSRTNSLMLKPKLFHGCHFFLKGKFEGDLRVADLQLIITSGGGKILTREPNPESIDSKKRPFHGTVDNTLEICTHFIIYESDENLPNNLIKYNMPHLKALPVHWLLNSVMRHEMLNPGPFRK